MGREHRLKQVIGTVVVLGLAVRFALFVNIYIIKFFIYQIDFKKTVLKEILCKRSLLSRDLPYQKFKNNFKIY